MNKSLQRFLAGAAIACLPLVITACGGGGGGSGGGVAFIPKTTVTGVSTMGTNQGITGAAVSIYTLLQDGRTGALLGTGTTDANGAYSVQIPVTGDPVLVEVTGRPGAGYKRVTAGLATIVPFVAPEKFRAVTDSVSLTPFMAVTPLTEAAYQKLQQILTINPALATSGRIGGTINSANLRITSLVLDGTENILASPGAGGMYQTYLLCVDQMIFDSGATANTVTVMNLIQQAFSDVTKSPYQTYLQALIKAVNNIKIANPGNAALFAMLDAILAKAGNPTGEPNWSDITPPTAPSNLTAATKALTSTTSSVLLSWGPSTDDTAVIGYDVYRDDVKIASVTTTQYTDQPLANNATYKYYVYALDAVGNRSVASNLFLVPVGLPATDVTPPTAPTNLSASTFLTTATASVVLMWSPSTDNKAVTGYDVYRNGNKIATVTSTGYTDPAVALDVTYMYYVIAFDGAGNRSNASSPLSVTPNRPSLGVTVNGQITTGGIGQPQLDVIAPTAPSNLTAATYAQTATTSSVVLSWSPSTDNSAVTGYEVYRMVSGVTTKIATVQLPGYTNTSVNSNVTYTYFILAFDAAGNRSIASNQLAVTPNQTSLGVTVNGQLTTGGTGQPQLDVVTPTAPSNLTASTAAISATASSVLLAWSPSSDNVAVSAYEVYKNGIKIATVPTLSYTDAPVTSNITYTYYIKAVDAAGNNSNASNQLTVTPNQASLGVTVSGHVIP